MYIKRPIVRVAVTAWPPSIGYIVEGYEVYGRIEASLLRFWPAQLYSDVALGWAPGREKADRLGSEWDALSRNEKWDRWEQQNRE